MNNYSSNYGEDVVRTANVLASCYLVDAAGSLKGLHYCTTGAAGEFLTDPQQPLILPPTDTSPGVEWYS
jgi:hypothetical protein